MRVSVIVPVFNEEKVLSSFFQNLSEHFPHEIIVVDGGSTDQTVAQASKYACVLRSSKGRASQMNVGAKQASGEILLFLHADTQLPQHGLKRITETVQNGALGGRFRMRFDVSEWSLKLFSTYTRFHCFSYGDQGFFVTRDLFNQMGGFREGVPFEDMDFYKRLRSRTQPVILKDSVITSARRFQEMGSWQQKWINFILVALYHWGMDIRPLKAKWYPDIR